MNQNPKDDRQKVNLDDVEELVGQMSLRSPPESLDQKVLARQRVVETTRHSWPLTVAAAISSLFVGLALGRMDTGTPVELAKAPKTSVAVETAPSDRSQLLATKKGARTEKNSRVRLIDEGLFLLNGTVPVRKYIAVSNQRVRVVNPASGEPVEMVVPVRKAFVTPSPGT